MHIEILLLKLILFFRFQNMDQILHMFFRIILLGILKMWKTVKSYQVVPPPLEMQQTMLFKLWDMAMKMELTTGYSRTHGEHLGQIKDLER